MLNKDMLEIITRSQLESWEKNKGTIPLSPKQKSLAQTVGSCQPRSLRSRLPFFKGNA